MKEREEWVVIGLEPGLPDWTSEEMTTPFQGFSLTLRPETETLLPTIAIPFTAPQTRVQATMAGLRFLSAFAWLHDGHGKVKDSFTSGGSFPIRLGKSAWHQKECPPFRKKLELDRLQEPADPKAWLALAMYREAQFVNSEAYELLGYFKIVNILADKGPQQQAWIEKALPLVTDGDARKRLIELQKTESDIPRYLYAWGRCAVAHAHNDPVVDPDDPEHRLRVARDLPLARALAEHAIEHALGVKSTSTIYREHLYQLAGFREILGPDLVGRLKAEGVVLPAELPNLSPISLRFYGELPFSSFDRMNAAPLKITGGTVVLRLTSPDQLAELIVALDFRSEHLLFDFLGGVGTRDDGSAAAIEKEIDRVRMLECCVHNGRLELWAAETETLLGRSDAIIPVNIDSGRTLDALRGKGRDLVAELERRQAAEAK